MRYIKSLICAIVLLTTANVMAQQDPNYTFYRYNMNLINPAYAGAHEGSELGVNIRSQWSNVKGAPETQSVFFSTGMGKNLGFGVSIINDKTFIENQTSLMLDFSYKLKLSEETNLFLGVKAGANSYNVNTEGLNTFGIGSDPSLMNLDGGFLPNVGAGAYLKGKDYFLAFSVPRILTSDRLEQSGGLAKLGENKIHMYLTGGYDIAMSDNIVFKPSVLLRYVDSAPISLDLTGAFSFNERFELAAAYRLDEGVSGYLIFEATKQFHLGYAYEVANENPVASISNGSHEIYMKIKF